MVNQDSPDFTIAGNRQGIEKILSDKGSKRFYTFLQLYFESVPEVYKNE